MLKSSTQRGLSLVETLIGLTVGLFLMGGAITMFVVNIKNSRKMLTEARLNQDLRAAADLVARDLRRAGYWQNSIAGTIVDSTGLNTTRATFDPVATTTGITYSVSQNGLSSTAYAATDSDRFGFKLENNILKMKIGSSEYQNLTDPNILTINSFSITESTGTDGVVDLADACESTCTTNCPKLTIRSYLIKIKGTAVSDSSVTRALQERVRVRNDKIEGNCPA